MLIYMFFMWRFLTVKLRFCGKGFLGLGRGSDPKNGCLGREPSAIFPLFLDLLKMILCFPSTRNLKRLSSKRARKRFKVS